MEKAFTVQTTTNINVAKIATFIIGAFLMLGSFYDRIYLFSLGIYPRKVNLTLLDYIRTGLDLLPITILFIFYGLFSIKAHRQNGALDKTKIVKNIRKNCLKNLICRLWVPSMIILALYILYLFGILNSLLLMILFFISPVFVYILNEAKISQIIKRRISFRHSIIIKITLVLAGAFSLLGGVDGYADRYHSDFVIYTVSLRTPTDFTSHLETNNIDVHLFRGYTMRVFDEFSIFDINGEIVTINNWEILSIEK